MGQTAMVFVLSSREAPVGASPPQPASPPAPGHAAETGTFTLLQFGPLAIRESDQSLRALLLRDVAWRDVDGPGDERLTWSTVAEEFAELTTATPPLPHRAHAPAQLTELVTRDDAHPGAKAPSVGELATRHRRALDGLFLAAELRSARIAAGETIGVPLVQREPPPDGDSDVAARVRVASALASAWLAREDPAPEIDALALITACELLDARRAIHAARGEASAATASTERIDHLLRQVGCETLRAIAAARAIAHDGPVPGSITLHPDWAFDAWEIVDRAPAAAAAAQRRRAVWTGLADDVVRRTRPGAAVEAELRLRLEQAADSLPLGVPIDGALARELADHICDLVVAGAAVEERTALDGVTTAVWESWGRVWHEPDAIAPPDRRALDMQRDSMAATIGEVLVPLADMTVPESDDHDVNEGAELAHDVIDAARSFLSETLDHPWNAWALTPFPADVTGLAMTRLAEHLVGRGVDVERSPGELRADAEMAAALVLGTLAVDYARAPRERARRIPFPDAYPGVVWNGGAVRAGLISPRGDVGDVGDVGDMGEMGDMGDMGDMNIDGEFGD